MKLKTFRFGWRSYLLLAGFSMATAASLLNVIIAQPAAAAPAAQWAATSTANCKTINSGNQGNPTPINAAITYTYTPAGQSATTTVILTCLRITNDTQNQGGTMLLSSTDGNISGTIHNYTATSGTQTVSIYDNNTGDNNNNPAPTLILNPTFAQFVAANGAPSAPGNSGDTSGSSGNSGACTSGTSTNTSCLPCPISGGLDWLLCPAFTLAESTLGNLNDTIASFLYVPTDQIFHDSTSVDFSKCTKNDQNNLSCSQQAQNTASLQNVFINFRDISLGLLVIAALVMVISQATGSEMFAAYTVKKALPRIVIAAIGIAIAWPVMEWVITFSNDLGTWIMHIILSATHVTTGEGTAGWNSAGAAIIATIVGVVILFKIGLGGAFSLVLTLLLFALVVLFVLAVRQLVIVLCIILAPIAIAASVLPSTEKLWHFWRETFMSTLLMFPLIMGFLAVGAAFAGIAGAVASSSSGGGVIAWDILAVLAYFAPYLLIPFAFSIAGGLMGRFFASVHGHQFSKGAFNQLRSYREQKGKENWQNFKAGHRFSGNNPFTGGINQFGAMAGAFSTSQDKVGFLKSRAARQEAYARHNSMVAAEWAKQPGTSATQFQTDMLWAQSYRDAYDAEQQLSQRPGWRDQAGNVDTARIRRALAAARAQGGFGRQQQIYAVQQLAANGTEFENIGDLLENVARVANGDDATLASLVGSTRGLAERAGRNDQKAGYGNTLRVARQIAANGNSVNGLGREIRDLTVDAALSVDNATLLRGKPKSVQNLTEALRDTFVADSQPGGNSIRAAEVQAKLENMRTASDYGYGPEANAAAISSTLYNNPAPRGAQTHPGQPQANQLIGNNPNPANYDQGATRIIGQTGRTKPVDLSGQRRLPNYANPTSEAFHDLRQRGIDPRQNQPGQPPDQDH